MEINQAAPLLTFYPDSTNQVEIKCPECLLKTAVDATRYQYSNRILNVKCVCGAAFKCNIDFRKSYRRKVNFAGEYEILKNRKLGDMLVENLSMEGVGFVNMSSHRLEKGDTLSLKFRLNDGERSEIRRKVRVVNSHEDGINAEFLESNRFDGALGYYLKR